MGNELKRFGFLFVLAASLYGGQQLIPAGSLMTCRVDEKISSKAVALGDPVLCTLRGRHTTAAYAGGSLAGQFQEYQDPGHFVGKGWMEIAFDELILPDARIVAVSAKVVNVPGYHVDLDGKILGKGHAVRDTITWFIPVLWPIDIINLPRRGPRPTLKPETRITVKIMDNVLVDVPARTAYAGPPQEDASTSTYQAEANYGFAQRPEQEVPTPFAYTGPVTLYPSAPEEPAGFFAGFRADWQAQRARIRAHAKAYRRYGAAQNAQIAVQRPGFESGSAAAPRAPVMPHSVVAMPRGGGRGQR